jgi:hypothetical protein
MTTRTEFVLLAMLVSLAVLPACWTYSLHPLYEDDDQHLTYDPALEGTWQQTGNECQTCRLLISGDSRPQQYTLQSIDLQKAKCNCGSADGPEIKFEGHLVQLGSHRFLDAVSQSDAAGMDAIPAHNIFKITKAQGADPAAPSGGQNRHLRRKFKTEVVYELQIFIAIGALRNLDLNCCSSCIGCFW